MGNIERCPTCQQAIDDPVARDLADVAIDRTIEIDGAMVVESERLKAQLAGAVEALETIAAERDEWKRQSEDWARVHEPLRRENESLRQQLEGAGEALREAIEAARLFNRSGMTWLEYDALLARLEHDHLGGQ